MFTMHLIPVPRCVNSNFNLNFINVITLSLLTFFLSNESWALLLPLVLPSHQRTISMPFLTVCLRNKTVSSPLSPRCSIHIRYMMLNLFFWLKKIVLINISFLIHLLHKPTLPLQTGFLCQLLSILLAVDVSHSDRLTIPNVKTSLVLLNQILGKPLFLFQISTSVFNVNCVSSLGTLL